MSTSTAPHGYVVREVTLGSAAHASTATLEQVGYGFELVAGAQFLRGVAPIAVRDSILDEDAEFGMLFDGARFACPGGFRALSFRASDDVPVAAVARVVVKVYTRPTVLAVEENGVAARSSVGLLDSALHPSAGATLHVSIPATGTAVLHDDAAQGFQANAPAPVAGIWRSRSLGGAQRAWWPSHAIYLHGFLATNANDLAVDLFAYLIDGNGARVVVPYMRLDSLEALASTYESLYTVGGAPLENVLRLGFGNDPSARIPYPINGLKIVAVNNDAEPREVAGILGVSST